jgi:hypothetical protein
MVYEISPESLAMPILTTGDSDNRQIAKKCSCSYKQTNHFDLGCGYLSLEADPDIMEKGGPELQIRCVLA